MGDIGFDVRHQFIVNKVSKTLRNHLWRSLLLEEGIEEKKK